MPKLKMRQVIHAADDMDSTKAKPAYYAVEGDELPSGWEAAIVAVGQEWTIDLTVHGMNQGHFFRDLYPTEDKALQALRTKISERAA